MFVTKRATFVMRTRADASARRGPRAIGVRTAPPTLGITTRSKAAP